MNSSIRSEDDREKGEIDEMKALVITEPGGFEKVELTDQEIPQPGPNEVLLKVQCAALNHLDLFVMRGLPGISYPHIQGADGAGVVESVGPEVKNVQLGGKVCLNPGLSCGECEFCRKGEHSLCVRFGILGEQYDGTFAEYVTVPSENVHPIPEGMSPEEAAAFPLTFLTAWRMLVSKAGIKTGETVLIIGIGGGVSCAALQICKAWGLNAIVTSGSDWKLDRARELGADETINHREKDFSKEVRRMTGKAGVDVVVDSVGEATWRKSLHSLRKGGRLVTCGATTGPFPQTDILRIFWNQLSIFGSTMCNRKEFEDMLNFVNEKGVKPVVDRKFSLEEGEEALRRLDEAEHFGKIVLSVEK